MTTVSALFHPLSLILDPSRYGAGDETRTRDPQLGRLMLYQLSYTRPSLKFQIRDLKSQMVQGVGFEPT